MNEGLLLADEDVVLFAQDFLLGRCDPARLAHNVLAVAIVHQMALVTTRHTLVLGQKGTSANIVLIRAAPCTPLLGLTARGEMGAEALCALDLALLCMVRTLADEALDWIPFWLGMRRTFGLGLGGDGLRCHILGFAL